MGTAPDIGKRAREVPTRGGSSPATRGCLGDALPGPCVPCVKGVFTYVPASRAARRVPAQLVVEEVETAGRETPGQKDNDSEGTHQAVNELDFAGLYLPSGAVDADSFAAKRCDA